MKKGLGSRWQGLVLFVAGLAIGGAVVFFLSPRSEPSIPPLSEPSTPRDDGAIDCERVLTAADEIKTYLVDRAAEQPEYQGHPLAGVPEDEQEAAWNAYLRASTEHMTATLAGFNANFAAESQALVDELAELGAWEAETELAVVNELGIQRLAIDLEAAALRTGCGG